MQQIISLHRMLGKLESGTGRSRNCLLRAPALSGRLRTVVGGRGKGIPGDVVNVCILVATPGLSCGSEPLKLAKLACGATGSVIQAD